jgi:hypothetical protein
LPKAAGSEPLAEVKTGLSTQKCGFVEAGAGLRMCAVFTDRFPGGTSASLRREWFVRHALRKLRDVPPGHRNPVNSFSTLSKLVALRHSLVDTGRQMFHFRATNLRSIIVIRPEITAVSSVAP